MVAGFLTLLGGVGLFLFAISVLTEALRDLAGPGLRGAVARFTITPLRGVATGTVVTAVLQSSAATLVMTLGLVGAGLMSFPQTLGVIYGSNIGSTLMTWIVAGLGVRVPPDLVAMPFLLAASLGLLMGRGTVARASRAVCGAALIFVALALMEQGLRGTESLLSPAMLPRADGAGRLGLFVIGLGVTLVIQSSTAGSAMLVVLLAGGHIGTDQAAALLLGMSVGSSSTGLIAALGGSAPMRQAAWANAGFNLGSAAVFLPVLESVVGMLEHLAAGDAPLALALFNTLHNLVGAMIFLPLTPLFARLIERLVPDRPVGLARGLDRALLSDPEAALSAATQAARRIEDAAFMALSEALGPADNHARLVALPERAEPAIEALESYLARIRVPEDRQATLRRYTALLHQIDHLSRIVSRARRTRALAAIPSDRLLVRAARLLAGAAARAAGGERADVSASRLRRVLRLVESRALRHRRATLLGEHAGLVSVPQLFERTDAMRWVEHAAENAERIAEYRLRSVADLPGPVAA